MNRLYKIIFIILTATCIISCSDKFLDIPPTARMVSSAFYKTMDQAEQAVTIAYSMFCKTTAWDQDLINVLGDVPSDDSEAGGDYENEVPGVEEFNRFTHLPTNGTLDGMYGILYRGIYFANLGMERIPEVLTTDPNADPDLINLRIAELKFIRAINTFYLVVIFGDVPLVDHVLSPAEYNIGRSTFAELFAFIEKDLNDAIPVLKERSELGPEDAGRASKGAAKALLAKAILFASSYARYYPNDERFTGLTERWPDVLSISEDIINSGEYRLVGSNGETYNTWHGPATDGYRFMFTVEGDNNDESIFEIQYINDGKGYALTRAGSIVQWTSPRYYTNPGGTKAATGYWGLDWPTQSLVDAFEPGDARFSTCISKPGDSVQVSGGKTYLINFDNSGTGYYCNKWVCSSKQFADAGGHGWQKSPANSKILRLGDIYLIAAEAAIMLDDNAKATTYINAVRARARACGGVTVPADLNGTVTIDQLIKERRVELAMEGNRFHDLVRWNLATSKLANTKTAGGNDINFESPKYDFMPIPARELTINKNLTQKYGW